MTENELLSLFEEHKDLKKSEFDSRIIPTKLPFYGIKMGELRSLAKSLINDDFLSFKLHTTYEMDMTVALAMAYSKRDISEKMDFYRTFYEACDNWALVDSVGLTIKPKNKEVLLPFIEEFISSSFTFLARFGYALFLGNFLDIKYLDYFFRTAKDSEDYYIMMIISWIVATFYTKYPEETLKKIKEFNFFATTKKNIIRKVRDSYRVDKELKDKILEIK